MAAEAVFVYRTLLDKSVDYKALGHDVAQAKRAILPGYKDLNRGSGYHTIIKDPDSTVKGKILFVTKKDLKKLDSWENKYRRIRVTLEDGSRAWAYQLKVHKIIEAYMKLSAADIRLFIDDLRDPKEYNVQDVVWVKNYADAIEQLKTGKVVWVSFDNDLSEEKTGYDVAKYIEENVHGGNIPCPEWQIHSANPAGRLNIERAMKSAERFRRE
jgi:gamma-glutamylcyclotransferase (GGCT)/AIG2-like uncharacterized protein YtfP